MKNVLFVTLLFAASILFSCGGASTNTASNADSVGTASDSNAAASSPATSSSTASSNDASSSSSSASAAPEVTTQEFTQQLGPSDGKWIDYPGQGQVFQPNVPADFVPYSTNGHWVSTNEGWTWASDYNWGWATFHYGGWIHDNSRGWLWKAGTEWAPARVTWSQSGGYYGWAPLPPTVAINAHYTPPPTQWSFVPKAHIDEPEVNKFVVNRNTNVTIVKQVTVINNITNNKVVVNNNNKTVVYNEGPKITDVEKVTNKKIVQVNITNVNKPGPARVTNNTINIYRPVINDKKVVVNKTVVNNKTVVKKPEPKKPEPKKEPGKRK